MLQSFQQPDGNVGSSTKIYIYRHINKSLDMLSQFSHAHLSAHKRTGPAVLRYWIKPLLFSPGSWSFVATADIGPLQHIAAKQSEQSKWSSFLVDEISLTNLAWIIVQDNDKIFQEIFQIGPYAIFSSCMKTSLFVKSIRCDRS